MKIIALISLIIFSSITKSFSWGFWGHKNINRMACFTLPPEMFAFYKMHIGYLTDHAVDPDKRRYSDQAEPPRHFLDADHYGNTPFDTLPENWNDAVAKFSEDSLNKYGIVPWYIYKMYFRLRNAFSENNVSKILYYSANIGHYIADAHVPLHCTENYNGQLTNQIGIHGFWESRLPELFGDAYDNFVGRAKYINDVRSLCWHIVKDSYAALDTVLRFESVLNNEFASDKKYAFEMRGSQLIKTYSEDYSKSYHNRLDGQVERRMQLAIVDVGSIWYSAWVDAGMPELKTGNVVGNDSLIIDPDHADTLSGKNFMKQRDVEE